MKGCFHSKVPLIAAFHEYRYCVHASGECAASTLLPSLAQRCLLRSLIADRLIQFCSHDIQLFSSTDHRCRSTTNPLWALTTMTYNRWLRTVLIWVFCCGLWWSIEVLQPSSICNQLGPSSPAKPPSGTDNPPLASPWLLSTWLLACASKWKILLYMYWLACIWVIQLI